MKHGRTFEFIERLPFPAADVYTVFRDKSKDLIPLLPNIESITVLSREEYAPGRVRVVNRWQGRLPPAVPKILRPFIKPELAQWIDHADWSDAERCVRWRFEMPQTHDLFSCEGENWVEEDGKNAVVRIKGTITLYPERLPGMPQFMADRLARPAEKWLLELIRPNMLEAPDAVRQFLKSQSV